MKISPARTAAFDVLLRIESEKAFSSVLLPLVEKNLGPKDRALCHNLTLGVLRRQIFLDRIIDGLAVDRKIDLAVRMALRLGLFQLHFLDKIPAHSAVNESVELVHRAKKSSARGFVNAILRRAQRESLSVEYADEIERLSVETSHPRWLIERWIGEFGMAESEALAQRNNEQPLLAFRATARFTGEAPIEGARPSKLVAGCLLADHSGLEIADAAARNYIYFQDEGSQLVGSVIDVPAAGRFLDVCAAPGSKITQIAATRSSGINIAGDIRSRRAQFLLENIRAQGVQRTFVVQYDAEQDLPFEDHSFDTVLVDAPCSGTGTIRHNPELRYFLRPEDISELSSKQRRILRNASKLVKEGGSLIYSTCSLEFEENERVAENFMTAEPSFEQVRPRVPDTLLTEAGFARTMPNAPEMDGFFIAEFVKAGAV